MTDKKRFEYIKAENVIYKCTSFFKNLAYQLPEAFIVLFCVLKST
jgi:hypothetical protein